MNGDDENEKAHFKVKFHTKINMIIFLNVHIVTCVLATLQCIKGMIVRACTIYRYFINKSKSLIKPIPLSFISKAISPDDYVSQSCPYLPSKEKPIRKLLEEISEDKPHL